jgi:hypothetical protein
MFHLVTTCVCRLNHIHLCIHDLVDPQPVLGLTTNNTKDNKINIGEMCWGVTVGKDKIYIGGFNKAIILNTDGSRIREIEHQG